MPEAVYVARQLNADWTTLGTIHGDVVGGDTALDTTDGDTSYAEANYRSLSPDPSAEVTFRLEQESGPTPPPVSSGAHYVLRFDIAFRTETTFPSLPFLFVGAYADSHGGRTLATFADQPTSYTLYEGQVAAETGVGFGDDILAAFLNSGSGQFWRLASSTLGGGVSGDTVVRVTYLRARLTWGVAVPSLRQRNRGRIRARNTADRQRSIRQRGYL